MLVFLFFFFLGGGGFNVFGVSFFLGGELVWLNIFSVFSSV